MSQEQHSQPWDVAIVGAGPVGLLLAAELATAGVRAVVFERDESPPQMSKANGVVGRAAVELAKRGVLAGTGLRVISPPRFPFGPLTLRLGIGPGNPLHILPIPQARLEELLAVRAARRGVEIRRGHEVTGFTQHRDLVAVDVCHGGVTASVAARYLVGCDGARSFVRKHAGIGFPGFTGDEIARIARVTLDTDQVTRDGNALDIAGLGRVAPMRPHQLPGGGFTIAPVSVLDPAAPEDLYVISTHEARGDDEPSESVSIDELHASLRRVLGVDLAITAASDIRSTVGNSRQADAYRRGRILLAGDAAHVFNAGGSALNVGLQDALDLAPRLTAALRGESADDELDVYDTVRRAAGHRALQHTRAHAALARNDEIGAALRETFGGLISSRRASRALARLIEQG